MNDSLISLFIDDEMDLDEKVEFVETVHSSQVFTQETVDLLEQEKLLHQSPPPAFIAANLKKVPFFSWSDFFGKFWMPSAGFVTALVLVALTSLLMPEQKAFPQLEEHRFVLYLPQASQPNIIGTFTGWSPLPMQKIGSTGYWALVLKVPEGEHRYSYLIDNGKQIADPTVIAKEHDDFGGKNTVIVVGGDDDSLS